MDRDKRLILLVSGILLAVSTVTAREPVRADATWSRDTVAPFEWSTLPALDFGKLAAEDEAESRKGNPGGFRFAIPVTLDVRPGRDGGWNRELDGSWVWRHGVSTPDAVHLNFGFSRFHLPQGAVLRITSVDGSVQLGPYTVADNEAHGQLWTPIMRSRDALLELRVPAGARNAVSLQLIQVGHGYRGFRADDRTCKSGACNMDVACLGPDDPWQSPRRAVATYSLVGFRVCTGALLNNVREDRRMLFLTAAHCGVGPVNSASMVVYWNFDNPSCRAPEPSNVNDPTIRGRLDQNQTGANFLAATANPFDETGGAPETRSDVSLVELDDPPVEEYGLHWSGWDRDVLAAICAPPADATSTSGLCATIHHPRGHEKRITFSEQALVVADLVDPQGIFVGGAQVHWRAYWDPAPPVLPGIMPPPKVVPTAATESGSSGAPLFNAQHRVVGVLSGGPSSCTATGEDLSDFYGQLAHAWEGQGTPETRVRDYLDPDASGALVLDGLDLFPLLSDGFEDP